MKDLVEKLCKAILKDSQPISKDNLFYVRPEWYNEIRELALLLNDLIDVDDQIAYSKLDALERETSIYDWCLEHIDEVRKYPDSHIAFTLNKGIVAYGKTDEEFAEMLKRLPNRDGLHLTHTSLFQ